MMWRRLRELLSDLRDVECSRTEALRRICTCATAQSGVDLSSARERLGDTSAGVRRDPRGCLPPSRSLALREPPFSP